MPRNVLPAAPLAPLTASIRLTMKTAAGMVEVTAAGAKPQAQPRPMLTLKTGEQPQVRWQIRNTDLKKAVPSVVVHFLVNREGAAGAPIPAGPQKGSYQDSVLGTDLPPKGGTSGEYATAVYEPGVYLVEIEILDEEGNRRMFCAVDLKVEP
jgi:hypothetical protein